MDWWQFVLFAEGGRVANAYDGELLQDWKLDAGAGLRAMVAGAVVRLDIGVSDEGVNGWVMVGQPF
jgi:outer membrane translocation and assembly module TamA